MDEFVLDPDATDTEALPNPLTPANDCTSESDCDSSDSDDEVTQDLPPDSEAWDDVATATHEVRQAPTPGVHEVEEATPESRRPQLSR